jgi:hypothetical protein
MWWGAIADADFPYEAMNPAALTRRLLLVQFTGGKTYVGEGWLIDLES